MLALENAKKLGNQKEDLLLGMVSGAPDELESGTVIEVISAREEKLLTALRNPQKREEVISHL